MSNTLKKKCINHSSLMYNYQDQNLPQ